MKKLICIVMLIILICNFVIVNASTYSYSGYKSEVQKIIDKYGVFEQEDDWGGIYSGLIYGEFIDFDGNGIEEMLLIYRDSASQSGWANVVVYGIANGKTTKMLDTPVESRIMQTDVSYSIGFIHYTDKVYLVINTVCPETKAMFNEKIIVFTMDGNMPVSDVYYGETLDFWETDMKLVYTKCMINNKLVLIEKYVDAINWIKDNSQELFLLYFEFYDEYENLQCISYSKMVNFLELLEQKASEEIIVLLNGKKIDFDVLPVVENGRTLVPLRAIFESLGAEVAWDESGIIRATQGETKVELRIGSNEMKVNNVIKYLDVPAKAINGRTMVPARAIAEAFGCSVSWDATNNAVIIN